MIQFSFDVSVIFLLGLHQPIRSSASGAALANQKLSCWVPLLLGQRWPIRSSVSGYHWELSLAFTPNLTSCHIFLSSVLSYSLFKGEEDGITTLPALKYPKLSIIDVSCNTFRKVTTPTDSRFFWIERQHIRSNSFCASLTIICNIKVISVVQCPFLFGGKPLLFHGRAFVENNNAGHENKVKTPLILADALSEEQGCFRAEEKHQ